MQGVAAKNDASYDLSRARASSRRRALTVSGWCSTCWRIADRRAPRSWIGCMRWTPAWATSRRGAIWPSSGRSCSGWAWSGRLRCSRARCARDLANYLMWVSRIRSGQSSRRESSPPDPLSLRERGNWRSSPRRSRSTSSRCSRLTSLLRTRMTR